MEMNVIEDKQDLKIIQEHCGDIIERIRACRSRAIAEQLRERLCGEVAQRCPSPLVQNVLLRHVDRIIAETFDENGDNKFLEA